MPIATWSTRKAPWVGAFFVLLAGQQGAIAGACSAPQDAEQVRIRYVHDGDTLVLSDNRRVRLIGVNAPEVAEDGQTTQALAIEARDHLRRLLFSQDNEARAVYGTEAKDRHGRYLANLWLPDGRSLAAELLREGLGWAVAIPPNVRFLDCYRDSEQSARAAAKGVWAHPEHAVREATQLDLRSGGFQLVQGTVVRVNRGGGALWINLQGSFAVRIPAQDLQWFGRPPDSSWIGKRIQVRGWLYPVKGEQRVTVRHPSDLELQP